MIKNITIGLFLFITATFAFVWFTFRQYTLQEIQYKKNATLLDRKNHTDGFIPGPARLVSRRDRSRPVPTGNEPTRSAQEKLTQSDHENELNEEGELPKEQTIREALDLEKLRTQDVALGYVPYERKALAIQQTLIKQQALLRRPDSALANDVRKLHWTSQGPYQTGGRTRAILVDLNDATRKTVIIGGIDGGIWMTSDITATNPVWKINNDWMQSLSIGALAQDPVQKNVMYAGTGDGDGTDARGVGIFKSIDDGATWNLLPATSGGSFNTTMEILVTPDSGIVYAATFAGMYKSKDQGNSWYKVLGSGSAYGFATDNFYNIQRGSDGVLFAATASGLYKSALNGEVKTWEKVSANPGFPTDFSRIQMAVASASPNIVYVFGSEGGKASAVYKTLDAGVTWQNMGKLVWQDGCSGSSNGTDITRTQAWYDLTLTVAPNNPNVIYLGGVDLFRSLDGGSTWSQITSWDGGGCRPYNHADQHGFIFEPDNPAVAYSGNDGGIFRIENANGAAPTFKAKNSGYVSTQFYAAAIHPDSNNNYFIAGAQDNGTRIVAPGSDRQVIGGDGFLCFIDQNNPNIQIGSIYYGQFAVSKDGGKSFSGGTKTNGHFLTPADYDPKTKILYAQSLTAGVNLWRFNVVDNTVNRGTFDNFTSTDVGLIRVDPNVANRVYIGSNKGVLLRANDAEIGNMIHVEQIGNFGGYISSIDIQNGDSSHLLVTISNYGQPNNIYESRDAGKTWRGCSGKKIADNLPDMPVRWGMFNPLNASQALIATETGVWSTALLNGDSTIWSPPVPGRGSPIVRVEMLHYRSSDKSLLAATFGRGLWTSNSLAAPAAVAAFDQITYTEAPVNFNGERSKAADTYRWNYGDGGTDNNENSIHSFAAPGVYSVSLTVNDSIVTSGNIKVLPSLGVPYTPDVAGYEGDFEKGDTHFGVNTVNSAGSSFERGVSTVNGKDGTHGGKNAYAVAPGDQAYKPGTLTELYTPNFDLSVRKLYALGFWAKFITKQGYDGFNVEYSFDKGISWNQLGSKDIPNWYNYRNDALQSGAFPIGASYFSGDNNEWTQFKFNISGLGGHKDVAFRFVFRSDHTTGLAGLAIDDVEVIEYDADPKTKIIALNGAFSKLPKDNGVVINLNWTTQPEFYATHFVVEQSLTGGNNFDSIATVKAQGVLSVDPIDYSIKTGGYKDVYFFRIKSISKDSTSGYQYVFYSPIVVVKRNPDAAVAINAVFPNPFKAQINISFTDDVTEVAQFQLFDALGRLILEKNQSAPGFYYELATGDLSAGNYFLKIKIGNTILKTIHLTSGDFK